MDVANDRRGGIKWGKAGGIRPGLLRKWAADVADTVSPMACPLKAIRHSCFVADVKCIARPKYRPNGLAFITEASFALLKERVHVHGRRRAWMAS